jgi:hypothetical protein
MTKKTIEDLVMADKNALSFECASSCIGELDVAEAQRSQESSIPIDKDDASSYNTENEKTFFLENATKQHFADVKFKALVDHAKKEDSFLFSEFVEVDAARNRIASEIISKYENEFNSFLVALKTAEGIDKSAIDSLIQTKIEVGEIS